MISSLTVHFFRRTVPVLFYAAFGSVFLYWFVLLLPSYYGSLLPPSTYLYHYAIPVLRHFLYHHRRRSVAFCVSYWFVVTVTPAFTCVTAYHAAAAIGSVLHCVLTTLRFSSWRTCWFYYFTFYLQLPHLLVPSGSAGLCCISPPPPVPLPVYTMPSPPFTVLRFIPLLWFIHDTVLPTF